MDRVLVLNSDFTPLKVTDIRRGFILVAKGKAEIVKEDTKKIVTTIGEFIRRGIKVGRKRIMKRDGNKCGYCGSTHNLTIDHIIPRSRGGDNSWINLVTCCHRCNGKKDNKTPKEAGMKLLVKVYEPTIFSKVISEDVETIWNGFKNSFK